MARWCITLRFITGAQVISTGDFDVCWFSPIAGVCLYIHSFRGAKSLCERERWKERPWSVLDM